jgi:hypothetical protein
LITLKQRFILGFFTFALPEVFAGSAPLYLINPFIYIITFPLYMLHFLLLTSLAIKFQRTSLKDLYLFGKIFGLYESWITKVLWAGYGRCKEYTFGSILGFGIHETIILVLFWHPVLAFLVPLLIYGYIFGDDEFFDLFPGLEYFIQDTKESRVVRWTILTIAILTTSFNMQDYFTFLGRYYQH